MAVLSGPRGGSVQQRSIDKVGLAGKTRRLFTGEPGHLIRGPGQGEGRQAPHVNNGF